MAREHPAQGPRAFGKMTIFRDSGAVVVRYRRRVYVRSQLGRPERDGPINMSAVQMAFIGFVQRRRIPKDTGPAKNWDPLQVRVAIEPGELTRTPISGQPSDGAERGGRRCGDAGPAGSE